MKDASVFLRNLSLLRRAAPRPTLPPAIPCRRVREELSLRSRSALAGSCCCIHPHHLRAPRLTPRCPPVRDRDLRWPHSFAALLGPWPLRSIRAWRSNLSLPPSLHVSPAQASCVQGTAAILNSKCLGTSIAGSTCVATGQAFPAAIDFNLPNTGDLGDAYCRAFLDSYACANSDTKLTFVRPHPSQLHSNRLKKVCASL